MASLNHDVCVVDSSAALVHDAHGRAAGVTLDGLLNICRGRDRQTVDLYDDITPLNPNVVRDAVADVIDDCATRDPNATFGANGGCERHELQLLQHRDFRCADLRQ